MTRAQERLTVVAVVLWMVTITMIPLATGWMLWVVSGVFGAGVACSATAYYLPQLRSKPARPKDGTGTIYGRRTDAQ